VGFDGLLAQVERAGDLLVGLACSREVDHGSLSSAQGVDAVGAESRVARFRGPLPESPQLGKRPGRGSGGRQGVLALERT
jgi:hypothetical protein